MKKDIYNIKTILNTIANNINFVSKYFTILLYFQSILVNGQDKKTAISEFNECLDKNIHSLEVRDLKDFYRIRGIPNFCCESLANSLLPHELTSLHSIDIQNCRLNAFFKPEGIFDPHTHPLHFVSYLISGEYTHTILDKPFSIIVSNDSSLDCTLGMEDICTEYSKIYTNNDTIVKFGTVKLSEVKQHHFTKGDLIAFADEKEIHRIDKFNQDTLTVNFISTKGDHEIDVFISHKTPTRKVLSKSEVKVAVSDEISKQVINKSLLLLKEHKEVKYEHKYKEVKYF